MKNILLLNLLLFLAIGSYAQSNFSTSLHATREGKKEAYKTENGGMELITNVPMEDLTCTKCHSGTGLYPNGETIDTDTYEPSCKDCHDFDQGNTVAETTCINCHNRQKYERAAYPDVDVHQAAGITCIECHKKEELHGDDGVAYSSLYEQGAIKVECEDCHTTLADNTSHNTHEATVDCAACHAAGVLTCASCHFETVVATGVNRAINQIKNYRLLVKKEDGKIGLGAFMTHTYDGKTNYIVNAYHSHAITKNATTCSDCHYNMGESNVAIGEYNESGTIRMTTWNADTKKIDGPTGVVPLPSDWKTSLILDFATYTGDETVFPSDPEAWTYLTSEVDNSHLYFAEPLDDATLTKLGFTRLPTTKVDEMFGSEINQIYPNPFNERTFIKYSIDQSSDVSIKIFDALGRMVKSIELTAQAPGDHEIEISAEGFSEGIFYCNLKANGKTSVHKMIHRK